MATLTKRSKFHALRFFTYRKIHIFRRTQQQMFLAI